MKSYRPLVLALAALAWFVAPPVQGACPLSPPEDCAYVDADTCGTCNDGVTNCTTNAECFGMCVGVCDDGTTSCSGDADCEGIFSGQCSGTCNGDGVTTCFGDVDCPGTCSGGAGTWDGSAANPFCRIQTAYDAATAGDTLLVLPGTYTECVDAWGLPLGFDKGVHLVADAFLEEQDNTQTVIDATGQCFDLPAVRMGGSSASIEGFTVTGGTLSGIFGQGNVSITNNRITGNSSVTGGGVYVYSGTCYYAGDVTVDVSDNTITANASAAAAAGQQGEAAGDGGGLYVFVAEFIGGTTPCLGGSSDVTIEGNTISNNTVQNTNVDPGTSMTYPVFGGGMYVFTSTVAGGGANVQVTQNTISGNTGQLGSESYGGGIWAASYSYGGTESIEIRNNVVTENTSTFDGGGVSAWILATGPVAIGDTSMLVKQNTISDNVALNQAGGVDLFVGITDYGNGHNLSMRAEQNTLTGNTSDSDGGGMLAFFINERSADAAAVADGLAYTGTPAGELDFTIEGNRITDNTSDLGAGGAGIFMVADADPESIGGGCGAINPAAATIDFRRNLVAGNRANNSSGFAEVGGGLLVISDSIGNSAAAVNIEDSSIVANTIDSGFVGGLEILPTQTTDCEGDNSGLLTLAVDRSIVVGNDSAGSCPSPGCAGIGGTPLGAEGTLLVPVTNTWVFGHGDNFDDFLFGSTDPPNNFTTDPLVSSQSYTPDACSPAFDLAVCRGTVGSCTSDTDCAQTCIGGADAGLPCTSDDDCDTKMCSTCLEDAGYHSPPDGNADGQVDGIDVLGLAVAFCTMESTMDPRYDTAADLDGNGVIDGEDLMFLASQFGKVCN